MSGNTPTNEDRIRALPFFASDPALEVTSVADGKNANYVVTTARAKYFVKTRTVERDRYHSVDIRREYESLRAVGDAGLCPKALYMSDDGRALIMQFLEGAPCEPETLKSAENLPRAALALRHLHAVDPHGVTYHFEAVIENYLQALEGSPLLTEDSAECVRWVLDQCQQSACHARLTMCHSDLCAQNLMDSDGIKFIDLEMGGENDLHFDLATFILFNGLNAEEEARFLELYGEVHLERLMHAKLAVSARDGLWALSEIASGKTGEFYPGCAASHFGIMNRARRA